MRHCTYVYLVLYYVYSVHRWVYLEGIFTSNDDISNLLPVETSRFNSISTEFLNLMKKVAKKKLTGPSSIPSISFPPFFVCR